jgi:hypothetical protein
MVASMAQYQALTSKAKEGCSRLQPAADQIVGILHNTYCSESVLGVSINPLCPTVKNAIREFQEYLGPFLSRLVQVLESLETVPVFIFFAGGKWQEIKSQANTVSDSTLGLSNSMGWWEGDAGQAYTTGVGEQYDAVSGISSTADTMSNACYSFFNAALNLAVAVVDIIAAFLNDIDTPAGIAGAVATAGTSILEAAGNQIPDLLGALAQFATSITETESQLKNALPIEYMPNGTWPLATAGSQ